MQAQESQESQAHNTVSILAEIPSELHEGMQVYLASNPDWDQDRVFESAIALFLLQNGDAKQKHYRKAARIYLDSLFRRGS